MIRAAGEAEIYVDEEFVAVRERLVGQRGGRRVGHMQLEIIAKLLKAAAIVSRRVAARRHDLEGTEKIAKRPIMHAY